MSKGITFCGKKSSVLSHFFFSIYSSLCLQVYTSLFILNQTKGTPPKKENIPCFCRPLSSFLFLLKAKIQDTDTSSCPSTLLF